MDHFKIIRYSILKMNNNTIPPADSNERINILLKENAEHEKKIEALRKKQNLLQHEIDLNNKEIKCIQMMSILKRKEELGEDLYTDA